MLNQMFDWLFIVVVLLYSGHWLIELDLLMFTPTLTVILETEIWGLDILSNEKM